MTDYKKYINALRKCAKEHENDITFTGHIIVADLCRDTANLLETLEQEPRWIPVSERLPKAEYGESDSVLVCFENGTQDVLYFDGSNWCYPTGETYITINHKNGWHNKVVAWMPLPQPFEPQESEDKEQE